MPRIAIAAIIALLVPVSIAATVYVVQQRPEPEQPIEFVGLGFGD